MNASPTLLAVLSCLFAGGTGCAAAFALLEQRRVFMRKRRMLATPHEGAAPPASAAFASTGAAAVALRYATTLARRLSLRATAPLAGKKSRSGGVGRSAAWLKAHAAKAGLAGTLPPAAFREARRRMALAGLLGGALVGALFSLELSLLLAGFGALVGFAALPWAIKEEQRRRVAALERDLSEMLDVVALGLRSGLSFDRSLELYVSHFDTPLSRALASAQRQWTMGLTTRETALRDVAATYDSVLFGRVVENIVRSLRFGSSLAESLEAAGGEARAAHRAHVEEKVAKAPIKMMIPTGTLILPAMLLLVLGPVLLELAQGF